MRISLAYLSLSHTQARLLQQTQLCPRLEGHKALQDQLLRSLLAGHTAHLHGILQLKLISGSTQGNRYTGDEVKEKLTNLASQQELGCSTRSFPALPALCLAPVPLSGDITANPHVLNNNVIPLLTFSIHFSVPLVASFVKLSSFRIEVKIFFFLFYFFSSKVKTVALKSTDMFQLLMCCVGLGKPLPFPRL